MRLVTYSFRGAIGIGAMLGDTAVVDLGAAGILAGIAMPDTMLGLLAGGDPAMAAARAAVSAAQEVIEADREQARDDGLLFLTVERSFRLEAPVPRPGKVLGIGLNYRDHAEESGQPIPERPIVFAKATTCITGPFSPIRIPRVSAAVDWEVELCLVIGKHARNVAAADAASFIAGYCVGNDVSVRDWQFHSPTWMMGKGFDTHGPIGPWITTGDDVDPSKLELELRVNGVLKQKSSTANLIFDPGQIIEYLSAAMTLEPGDVVFTGTPGGVGFSAKPPEFLKVGDVVRAEIEGLGAIQNPVVSGPED